MIITEIKKDKYLVEFVINGRRYTVLTGDLKYAIKEVERWQSCGGSSFNIKLIELIAKADEHNKLKILQGFPEEMCAYLLWYYNMPLKKELLED
jgi:hypothetical protein